MHPSFFTSTIMTSLAASVSLFLFLFLLLSTTTVTAATTHPSDVAGLKAIKAAIDPTTIPDDSCLASWNFTSDPCFPHDTTHFICGIDCASVDNRIWLLSLDAPGYAGTISPLISKLTGLNKIELSNNRLSGPIPASIFSLPNLHTLDLRNNSFSGTIPPSISTSKNLGVLDLSYNSLSGSLPNKMSNTIFILDLRFNKLTGPIPKLPSSIMDLKLSSNYLSGHLTETSFNELVYLEIIDLSANSLTGPIPGWFFLQPKLSVADLSNNRFTGIEVFKPVKSDLTYVYADYNNITGYLPKNFAAYPGLYWLSLRHNKLKGPIPDELSRTTKLKRLSLDGNYLNGKPSKDFFSGKSSVLYGSFGNNCLKWCPKSSKLCSISQKSLSACRKAYGGRVKV